MKRTGPTNIHLRRLASALAKQKTPLWKRVAGELMQPTRQRRAINLSRIDANAKAGETIVVPGKVLGSGNLSKKLTIAAWKFTDAAFEKINKAGGQPISLETLAAKKIKRVRILG